MGTAETSASYHLLVEAELNYERANALGRSGRRMQAAVDSCSRAAQEVAEAISEGLTREQIRGHRSGQAYRNAFDDYQRAYLEFVIQREANKQYDHRLVDEFYPPPPPLADLLR